MSWINHTEKITTLWPQITSFWPKINIPSSYFTILMLNCVENTLKLLFDKLCDSCQILDLNNFQNNFTWPNSNTAGISLDSRLKYSKITHMCTKKLSIHLVLVMKTSHWYRFHPFYLSISPVLCHKCQRMFSWASCTSARHAGSFECLMTSLDHSDYNGQWQWALCMLAVLQSFQPNPQRNERRKMYAIKKIKI